MARYSQGVKVKESLPTPRLPLLSRPVLDKIYFDTRKNAYELAMANRLRPWAIRWLRAEGYDWK